MAIAGVDEAGRGPLAGPVIAAAVILDPRKPIKNLADSKQLTEYQREMLYIEICRKAIAFAIGRGEVEEIDSINILQASLLAMRRAVAALGVRPTQVMVDGNQCPGLEFPTVAIIKGDDLIPAISAASILAKVTRDREMVELDKLYPEYGFASHKGYGTPEHRLRLQEHGPCIIHRRSFAPVREAMGLHPVAAGMFNPTESTESI